MAEEEHQKKNEFEKMDLVDHLDELRRRLIWSLAFIAAGSLAGWWIAPFLLDAITSGIEGSLQYFRPQDGFIWRLKLAMIVGVIIASPLIIVQIWLFIKPALTKSERRFAFPTIFSAIILFFGGCAFATLVVPYTLSFLEKFAGEAAKPHYSLDGYIGFVGMFILAFGIVFEVPVVLVLLAKLGIVSYEKLVQSRKYAILISMIIGSLLTPADPTSMFFLAVPLYTLFEASLVIIRFMKKPGDS